MSMLNFMVLLALGADPAATSAANPSQVRDVNQAVERSLTFLEAKGVAWKEERGCASCHTFTFTLWSHNEAKQRGFPVDARKLDDWTNWTLANTLARGKEGGGLDTMSQMLLGRDPASAWRQKPARHLKTVDPFETIWEYIIERQNVDGSWNPEGQLSSPAEVTTGWALLALASRDTKEAPKVPGQGPSFGLGPVLTKQLSKIDEALSKSRERALAYLKQTRPDDSTEALLLRMLIQRKYGDAKRADELRQKLLARQNPDGGWAYKKGAKESDAFATGQCLYALSIEGLGAVDPALQNARRFLVQTQAKDGSWFVDTNRVRATPGNRAGRTDPIYTYWGTAWATIGLLRTLPAAVTAK